MTANGIAFETLAPAKELMVTADAEMLEQALINLLQNAIDAVDQIEGPRVMLSCRLRQDGRVAIAVADNGKGLDPGRWTRYSCRFIRQSVDLPPS